MEIKEQDFKELKQQIYRTKEILNDLHKILDYYAYEEKQRKNVLSRREKNKNHQT